MSKIRTILSNTIRSLTGNDVDVSVANQDTRVPEVMTRINYISAIDLNSTDIEQHLLIVNGGRTPKPQIITWFIPCFEYILYGGIYTIFRFACFFQKNGMMNNFVIYDASPAVFEDLRGQIIGRFPELTDSLYFYYDGNPDAIPASDLSIATFWTSCFISAKFNRTKAKFYFIQDYEPLFYSAGSFYGLAEMTYRLGFRGIVNTPGLADYISTNFNMECVSFLPCVDKGLLTIDKKQLLNKLSSDKKKINILFYGRPAQDRNAFELAIVSLIRLKKQYGDKINIYSAGNDWDEQTYGVKGYITNLGRIHNLTKLAKIYRIADIGLVLMMTKHPSYLPFEMMACGCAVVTNYKKDTDWLFINEINSVVTEPLPGFVSASIAKLIDDNQLRRKIVSNALRGIEDNSWDRQCEKIFQYISG